MTSNLCGPLKRPGRWEHGHSSNGEGNPHHDSTSFEVALQYRIAGLAKCLRLPRPARGSRAKEAARLTARRSRCVQREGRGPPGGTVAQSRPTLGHDDDSQAVYQQPSGVSAKQDARTAAEYQSGIASRGFRSASRLRRLPSRPPSPLNSMRVSATACHFCRH